MKCYFMSTLDVLDKMFQFILFNPPKFWKLKTPIARYLSSGRCCWYSFKDCPEWFRCSRSSYNTMLSVIIGRLTKFTKHLPACCFLSLNVLCKTIRIFHFLRWNFDARICNIYLQLIATLCDVFAEYSQRWCSKITMKTFKSSQRESISGLFPTIKKSSQWKFRNSMIKMQSTTVYWMRAFRILLIALV